MSAESLFGWRGEGVGPNGVWCDVVGELPLARWATDRKFGGPDPNVPTWMIA